MIIKLIATLYLFMSTFAFAEKIKLAVPKSTNHDLPILKALFPESMTIEQFELPFDKINKPHLILDKFDAIGTYAITDKDRMSASKLKDHASSTVLTWSNHIFSSKQKFEKISDLKDKRVYAFSGMMHVTKNKEFLEMVEHNKKKGLYTELANLSNLVELASLGRADAIILGMRAFLMNRDQLIDQGKMKPDQKMYLGALVPPKVETGFVFSDPKQRDAFEKALYNAKVQGVYYKVTEIKSKHPLIYGD